MSDPIDTSAEAVERLASRVNTVADWRCYGIAATLRALLVERDVERQIANEMKAERDAAQAEAARLREALEKIASSEAWRGGMIARDALAKEAEHE